MSIELVHCTTDAEKLIVKMARVSNPANQDNEEGADRLLRYLLKHKHFSPFEMASMCVKIETERDIAAQILRHRSFSFQEYSSRYSPMPPAELPSLRKQATTNRQSSVDGLDPGLAAELEAACAVGLINSYTLYQRLLDSGVARECARRVLPLCTPTTLYMHGTLRSWITYIAIREDKSTQLEHRQIALDIKQLFQQCFPIIHEALGGTASWEI